MIEQQHVLLFHVPYDEAVCTRVTTTLEVYSILYGNITNVRELISHPNGHYLAGPIGNIGIKLLIK